VPPTATETVEGLNLMAEVLSSSSEHEANATANAAQTINVANLKNFIDFILFYNFVV
jgi:hypothetical protein